MRALLESYGLLKPRAPAVQPSPALQAAERKSSPFVNLWNLQTRTPFQMRRHRRSVGDLKTLSESVLPSRAISLIRKAICSLTLGVQANEEAKTNKIPEQRVKLASDTVRAVLRNPNGTDKDFAAFIGQVVEDILIFDAGCWEYVMQPAYGGKNTFVGMEVVPGYSMAQNVKWSGKPNDPRWAQFDEGGKLIAPFLNDEIEYMMQRKRSWVPFGLSPLEVAVDIMDKWLGLSTFQGNVASDNYPAFMFYLGEDVTNESLTAFRSYWENDVIGRGKPGIFGAMGKEPKAVQLKSTNDEGLYLKYQEMLVRVLAFAFDLKPQDFGLERDVNRSQGEVSAESSESEGVRPIAEMIVRRFNESLLPKIAVASGNADVELMEVFWTDLSRRDTEQQAAIHKIYLDADVMTLDEVRGELDLPPMAHGLGALTKTQYQELARINPTPDEMDLNLVPGVNAPAQLPPKSPKQLGPADVEQP